MEEAFNHNIYPKNSSGRRMVKEFFAANKNELAGPVLNRLKKIIKKLRIIDYIYVIENDNRLIGVISIKDLLNSSYNTPIKKIMRQSLITVSPESDQEKAADIAVKNNIKAIPVVKRKKLIGIITPDIILSILNKSLREDVLHIAGIHKSHLNYENTLEVPLFMGILHRIPWLIIGLIGITAAALFTSMFESTLQSYLILAFFIPAILYMSNALGIQNQTLFIRDLAISGKELNIKLYFLKQLIISFFLACIISLIVFSIINIFWNQQNMAIVIAISMFITLIVSTFTALMTTLIINKFKLDPALGSVPFATIVSDVLSITIYFIIASIFIRLINT